MGKIVNIVNNSNETQKKIKEDFEEKSILNKYNMERVSRECLVRLGVEDNRSEFDKKRDKLEDETLSKEVDEIIKYIQTHPEK